MSRERVNSQTMRKWEISSLFYALRGRFVRGLPNFEGYLILFWFGGKERT